jgi:hypothetical protein
LASTAKKLARTRTTLRVQLFAIRRLGHGFDHERVQGEDEGAEGGGKQNGRRRGRRRYMGCRVGDDCSWPQCQRNESEEQRRIQRVEQDAGQAVAERVFFPERGVEHERREVHRTVAIEFVLSDHAEGQHIVPICRIVDVIAVEDLGNRVIDKAAAQRREVKQRNEEKNTHARPSQSAAGIHGQRLNSPCPIDQPSSGGITAVPARPGKAASMDPRDLVDPKTSEEGATWTFCRKSMCVVTH